jgi:predicted NBD/HSP70 family sugar kinase
VNILDPDVIVLGGGVSNIEALYRAGNDRLRQFIFHEAPTVRVVRNQLGDSAGVFGAALLCAGG